MQVKFRCRENKQWASRQWPAGTRALFPGDRELSHCTHRPLLKVGKAEPWRKQAPWQFVPRGWLHRHSPLWAVLSSLPDASPCRWLKVRTGSLTPEVTGVSSLVTCFLFLSSHCLFSGSQCAFLRPTCTFLRGGSGPWDLVSIYYTTETETTGHNRVTPKAIISYPCVLRQLIRLGS